LSGKCPHQSQLTNQQFRDLDHRGNSSPDGKDTADLQNVHFNLTVKQLMTHENFNATRNILNPNKHHTIKENTVNPC
jgi:hypothetical protein